MVRPGTKERALTKSKILALDIETAPATAYLWQFYDANVSPDQVLDYGRILCVAAKFLGDKKVHLFSEWEHGRQAMLEGIHTLMSEADALCGYNSDKFDLPILNGEFALAGMGPPRPASSIDVYKTIKTLKLGINKLGAIGPRFGLGEKLKHEGFALWKSVMDGDVKAQKRMGRYCIQDVRLLEALYKRVLPFIKKHPHLLGEAGACPNCGSKQVQSRGWRPTRTMLVQRLHCQDCGSWHEGRRKKI